MIKLILISTLAFFFTYANLFSQQTGEGTITDENAQPIVGVSVLIEGTTKGTTTDFDGKYSLTAEPGQTLFFTYLGFKSLEEEVIDGKNTYNFVIIEDQLLLDQVIVTGIFNRKSLLESSVAITTMKAKDIEKVGYTRTADILRSVPGVFDNSGNGEAENIIYSREMSAAAGPSGAGYRYVSLTEDGLPIIPFTADGL